MKIATALSRKVTAKCKTETNIEACLCKSKKQEKNCSTD